VATKLFDPNIITEGEAIGFALPSGNPAVIPESRSAFAIKKDGEIYAYINSCPHIGVELNWQENQFLDSEGELIQCSTHGALFLINSGECVSGPCAGQCLQPVKLRIEPDGAYISD